MKRICILMALTALLSACSRGPEPILYGRDACAHCKMTIMDKRFAAEIVTGKGKVYKFDSAECMADFLKDNAGLASNDKTMFLVSYYDRPGTFENATNSVYLQDAAMHSPMGGNVGVFTSEASARSFGKDTDAKIYNWAELLRSR
ncbi:MAG TPA: nitrous oxide reductase accessory protein NosL [Mucilaginibacter sp.]|nr:nitrous oxide reductase accessory protein NosL [Mucilaginibacter sp.]